MELKKLHSYDFFKRNGDILWSEYKEIIMD